MTEVPQKVPVLQRWGPAVLGLACLVAAATLDGRAGAEGPSTQAPAAVSDELRALVGGLEVDERVAGWAVLGVEGPPTGDDGAAPWVRIDFGRDGLRFSVTVAPLGTLPEGAPRSTQRHALYYGHPHPRGAKIPDNATRAILANVERRVLAYEAAHPAPSP